MPNKRFATGCRAGYDSNKHVVLDAEMAEQGKSISSFLIPKDETTQKQWLKNIPCTAEDNPQGKRCWCSLHLKNTQINTSTVCRGTKRKLKSLKKGAIPSVFTTVPYSTNMKVTCRKKRTTTISSSGTRRADAWILNEQNTEACLAMGKFESL